MNTRPVRQYNIIVSRFLTAAPFLVAGALALHAPRLAAQGNMPAGPTERKKLATDPTNRFQVGIFVNGSYNVLKGGYYGDCPCDFVKSGTGASVPFGLTLNVPITDDASIYLRAGFNHPVVSFTSGRNDTLRGTQTIGPMYDDLTITSSVITLEVLLRLIADEEGFRLFAGPSFGFIRSSEVELWETEAESGKKFLVEKGPLADASGTRTGFVLGIEYAYVPAPRIYVIPSLSFDYGVKSISLSQPLRPLIYHFSLSLAYTFY